MFLFYNYYGKGKSEQVPYFSTLCAMSFLLFLHIAAILCWANKEDLLFGVSKNAFIVRVVVLFAIFLTCFWRVAPEKELQMLEYEEQRIKKGGWVLVFYIILAMALLFLGAIY